MTETGFDLGKLVGPSELLTSPAIISRCVGAGFQPAHARQIVRRNSARNGIWRSQTLALPNNGRLFSQTKFLGSQGFIDQLLPILEKERPGLHRLVRKLLTDKVVLKPHAQMLLASPINPTKARYPSYHSEIHALEEVLVARLEASDTADERVVLRAISGTTNASAVILKAQTALLIEAALTGILINHLRRHNIVAWNNIINRRQP